MDERLAYIEKLEAQIKDAQTTLTRLKTQKEAAIAQRQHEEIEQLEVHLENAQVKLEDIRSAASEAWQEIKEGLDDLLRNLSESLKKLM